MPAGRRTILPFALLLFCAARPVGAQTPASTDTLPLDPDVRIGVLPNGIRYYVRRNARPERRAELRLAVNAGSVQEEEDQRGLAHLVEHMAFNGTRSFPRTELVKYLESIGMRFGPDINAYTSFDETVYMLQVPTDRAELLARGIDILEDWAHGQTLDPAEIDKERGVVVEEWRLGQGAGRRMFDKQLPVLFEGSRYAERLPIGKRELLETFPHAALKRFYSDWYRPDLMAVVAVGDFDVAAVEALIRDHFGRVPAASAALAAAAFPVPDRPGTRFAITTDPEATNSSATIYHRRPLRNAATVGALRETLVERLYAQMLNARFSEIAQKPAAPFLGAGTGSQRLVRTAEFHTLGVGVRDGGLARGFEAMLTEAERLRRHGFTTGELERAKADLLRGYELAYAEREKTNSSRFADEYVRHYLEREPIPGIAHEYRLAGELVPGIRLEETDQLAREALAGESRIVLVSAPEKPGARVPTEAELLAIFAAVEKQPIGPYEDVVVQGPLVAEAPAPGRIVSEKQHTEVGVTEWRLANGVRVLLKPTDFKADEIVFSAYSPGGTSLVKDSDYIPALFATQVLDAGGMGRFSAVELEKALAGKAAGLGRYIGQTEEGMSGSASPKDLETLFQLIHLTFTGPRPDSAAFLSLRNRFKGFVENRGADPVSVFMDSVEVTLFQHHPRARPFTTEVLDEMDFRKSVAFYRDRFADAGDFTFTFVGSFQAGAMRPFIERWLGSLPSRGRKEKGRDVGMRPPTGVVTKTIRKGIEPVSQTEIIFTGPFPFSRQTRFELMTMVQLLEIRLRDALREELGGTYSVEVDNTTTREPRAAYSVSIRFGSAPDRADEMAAAIFREIDRLAAAGPTPEEAEKIRELQRRARETGLKQNGYWLAQLGFADHHEYDFKGVLAAESMIARLDAASFRNAARTWLRKDNYIHMILLPETAPAK